MNKIINISRRRKCPIKNLFIPIIILLGISLFLYQQNNMLTTTAIILEFKGLPKAFDGYKIVHLSDLHGKSFGKNQKNLVDSVKKAEPDVIVFTGDLIDSRRYKEEHSISLMKELVKITNVYYVNGNHEGRSGQFKELEKSLLDVGVKVLRNTSEALKRGDEEIYILGVDDPFFDYRMSSEAKAIEKELENAMKNIQKENSFKLLLSHRPEMFSLYIQSNINVVFSGHVHGGQFRLPFIGGLVAPGQGILPKYTAGEYKEENTSLIVSRGLGNSLFPQRLFNRPEVIVVKLNASSN